VSLSTKLQATPTNDPDAHSFSSYYCDNSRPISPTKAEEFSSHKKDGGYCCFWKIKDETMCFPVGPYKYK
jgi:hypothetical protein